MLLHIPHSSVEIPKDIRATLLLSEHELQKELLCMTDWYTHQLFDREGAERLIYPFSRLVCDPERFSDDALESMAYKGMGAIYTRTSDGSKLRRQLSLRERQRLLERFYLPHHAALETMVQSEINAQRYCLIIDCHSFSSVPLPHEPDQRKDRPKLCIGTDGFHTPEWLIQSVKKAAGSLGWTVEINRPFSGTIVPISAYGKDRRVLSVMLEINRSFYMEERTGEKRNTFNECKEGIQSLLDAIQSAEMHRLVIRRQAPVQEFLS